MSRVLFSSPPRSPEKVPLPRTAFNLHLPLRSVKEENKTGAGKTANSVVPECSSKLKSSAANVQLESTWSCRGNCGLSPTEGRRGECTAAWPGDSSTILHSQPRSAISLPTRLPRGRNVVITGQMQCLPAG